jgi:hypothetical protein
MSSNGDTAATVCRSYEKTLRKYFAVELATGRAQVRAAIGASIVRQALAGNINAARYWLSTHGGPEWREIGGFDVAPISVRRGRRLS